MSGAAVAAEGVIEAAHLAKIKAFAVEHNGSLRSYSGRCMWGEKCLGVTVGRWDYEEAFKAAKRLRSLGAARSDSMGLDMIIYFPDAGAPSQAWLDSEDA